MCDTQILRPHHEGHERDANNLEKQTMKEEIFGSCLNPYSDAITTYPMLGNL